ncbi:MAG: hypothetical protein M1836_007908 [Candelina mexicana]|nr:MAG: hypothetical protein M1836_007908 [Candelina mexicana]
MAVSKKRSLSDMEDQEVQPSANAFDDFLYRSEVLELANGQTEEAEDEALEREAIELGIAPIQQPDPASTAPLPPSASTVTVESMHVRSGSSTSRGSRSTGLTSRSSKEPPNTERTVSPALPTRRRFSRKSAFVTEYDRFLANAQSQEMSPSSFPIPPPIPKESSPSILSDTSTRSTSFKFKRSLSRFSRTKKLKQTIDQTSTPIPGAIVKAVLSRDEQQSFLKSVLQFTTPWEDRVFCPNPSCGEFIPKKAKIDPKHPFEVVCKSCKAKACKTCKREAHSVGQDCPEDWELDAVLQMGENQGWRRCYKCKTLVELSHGCTHMTCRCKAQFCYICGAVWDREVGCPNFCNGEEELERRRQDEIAAAEAEITTSTAAAAARTAESYQAMQRSIDNEDLQALRKRQIRERDRFLDFEQKQRWLLWIRHEHQKAEMTDRQTDAEQKLKDRHLKTVATLEDRQVNAEIEFRQTLNAERRACSVRLRHMEAYCHSLSAKGTLPSRVVTDRDLRELRQQYSVRDSMERLHESRINVLREKQAKQLETLVKRQEEELERSVETHVEEGLEKEERAREEGEAFEGVVAERRERLGRRWARAMEIARRRLEVRDGVIYGPLLRMEWGLREEMDGMEDGEDGSLDLEVDASDPPEMDMSGMEDLSIEDPPEIVPSSSPDLRSIAWPVPPTEQRDAATTTQTAQPVFL